MAMPRHERNFICIGHECHRELAEYVVFSLDALAEVEQNGNINVSKKMYYLGKKMKMAPKIPP